MGGGSDLPAYLKSDFGQVISFTIDKFVYIAVHSFFAGGIRVSYSEQEQVNHAKFIKHPIIRETLLELNFNESIELGSFADVPASGTGLGSSSAFTNALIAGLAAFVNKTITKEQIARLACKIEIERCRHLIGFQDQWATAFGGLNLINFSHSDVSITNLNIESKAKNLINKSLRLFYLNKGRSSGTILSNVSTKISNNPQLRKSIRRSVGLVPSIAKALELGDVYSVGSILDEGWRIKQELDDSITDSEINEIYADAKNHGAVGGKIVGAGGGGFLLLCIPQVNAENFDRNFNYLRELKFSVESRGVNIVYNDILEK